MMMNLMMRLWKDEEGQGLVEYGLIIALVAVFLVAALTFLRGGIDNVFRSAANELNDAVSE